MKTVLLTGFAGFIGSQLLKDLMLGGYKVFGLDNLSEGSSIDNYWNIRDMFTPIYANINDEGLGRTLDHHVRICGDTGVDKIDYVVNCAADSHVDRSWDQIDKFIDSNIKGPINLAKWALDNNVKKFVQVSTDEVWGGSEQPFTEGSAHSPENIYSSSKASAEFFLSNFCKAYNLPLVLTNGANTYGVRQMEEKIIPKTISKILSGKKIPLYETPARRMWLHVEDHSAGIIAALESGVVGERYCLAPSVEQELYTEELVKLICENMGVKSEDFIEYVPDRLNYDLRYYMWNDKAKIDLGWNPTKEIKKELPKVISWYKTYLGH